MTAQTETHAFEAEVQEVLNLVIHSLYANKEIFLRELVSNASDALDKLRFGALTNEGWMEEGETLGIALDVDSEARVLTIADNGVGMSHDELVQNLGTIASSGTRRFLEQLKEQKSEGSPDLIGQFGVGFYSGFMVADDITVETRKAGTDDGWRWHSKGDGEYSIEAAQDLSRGTVIRLHLREKEEGEDDLLAEWKLREIIGRYSDFVEYPIQMEVERSEPKLDDDGKPLEEEAPEIVRSTETLNSMKPLWARPKKDITPEEYEEFYKHVAHDWNGPLETVHFSAEGTLEFTALLYLPKKSGMDLFDPSRSKSKVSLYVKRVLIMPECEDLLPTWLRFVRGIVESSDLPLNVSRETLQDNPRVAQIQRRLVKKVIETMTTMHADDREAYEGFWAQFGPVLKEGIHYGDDDDQRLSKIALFQSSNAEGWTTLGEYIERMPEGQEAIYTITGSDRKSVESSPHLEGLRAKGYEVLYLIDPVDEWWLPRLPEFDGKPLQAADRGEFEAGDEEAKKSREEKQEEHKDLLESLRGALDEEVQEVRFTDRLTDSPAVLVSDPNGLSPALERMLRSSGQDVPPQKRILELNANHALVGGLQALHAADADSPRLADYAALLFAQAQVSEGSAPSDPARFARLLTDLMVEATAPR